VFEGGHGGGYATPSLAQMMRSKFRKFQCTKFRESLGEDKLLTKTMKQLRKSCNVDYMNGANLPISTGPKCKKVVLRI
jgi:hypothetical protein